MKKLRIALIPIMIGMGIIATFNACEEDDPAPTCSGTYDTRDECQEAIKGVDNCECESDPGNNKWIALPIVI